MSRCCGVTVAAIPARAPSTNCSAALVVMCSNTMRRLRVALGERLQHRLDEARLALEDVHRRIGDLAVHLQHQVELRHALEHPVQARDIGDAGLRVRGGAGRVELARRG